MEDALKNFLEVTMIALLNLGGVYVVYLINKFATYLKTKTQMVENEKQRMLIESAISRVKDLCEKAVNSTEQTLASELRYAVKTGVKDRQELLDLGKRVADSVYAQINPETENLLKTEIIDLQTYIQDLVEENVLKLKR